MSTPVTSHFTIEEFDSHDNVAYPMEFVQDGRLLRLCNVLEKVRWSCGDRPMVILSGYRSPAHNAVLRLRSTGVAKNSRHTFGDAADVVVAAVPPAKVHQIVLSLYANGDIPDLGGLGVYPGWVHIDVRPKPADGHLARWIGDGFGSEPVA